MTKVIRLTYATRLLLVIVSYLGLHILAENIAWALRKARSGRLGAAIEQVRTWSRVLHAHDIVRLAYCLIIPYVVLSQGWVSPLDLGLADLDWIRGSGVAAALAAGSLVLLAFTWSHYARLVGSYAAVPHERWLAQPWGWAFGVREAIYLEASWALVRSPVLLLAGPYFGAYLGLAAVYAAGLLNARVRHELSIRGAREEVVLTASLAIVTATLYVYVHNLWLCIAAHASLRLAVARLVQWHVGRIVPRDLDSLAY